MGDPLVSLEDVSVRFGSTLILDQVSLRLDPGEVLGIAGPNGAGKSTLLEVVATLVTPSSGVGQVLGCRLGTPEVVAARPSIGWSGHDPGLYPELTLAENLELVARVAGVAPASALEALAAVGLAGAAHRRADRSSNGMQRRTDLSRLLMLRPALLLLDEAHAGLDESAEVIIDELLTRVKASGGGAVLVSHDAARLADRVDRMAKIEAGALG